MSAPAIVISAYNRPTALRRLLGSLLQANYAQNTVPLIIVVDGGNTPAVQATLAEAQSVMWPFGPKEVIQHSTRLGLQGNVFFCWSLAERLGSIIHLEDDVLVSPAFYSFAASALPYYNADEHVGLISLCALWFNGFTHEPFVPLLAPSDVFFVQVPFFQGLAFTREQWRRFDDWCRVNSHPSPVANLHPAWLDFPATDWMPLMAKYLAHTERFTVFPRLMLCTATGEMGTHFTHRTDFFRRPLFSKHHTFQFESLEKTPAAYDAFFEPLPNWLRRQAPALAGREFDVDLYATKRPENLHAEFTLTTRPTRRAALSFGAIHSPLELNLIETAPGCEIVLSRPQDLYWGHVADWAARDTVAKALGSPCQPSRRRTFQRWLGRVARQWFY
ncbi:MAG: hypothetical protein JNL09_07895 [Anaerolineales bacterium]|nr:hypothetical protein [Anaerolineales bacterium]